MVTEYSARFQRIVSLEALYSQPAAHTTLFDDKVFGQDDWVKYRSAAWRHRIEPTVFLRVAVGFYWQLLLVILVSVGVGLLHTLIPGGVNFLTGEHFTTPYTMITFALSLLLVFKTNSSYSRWWEGRIIWGQVVNFGRNYARQALMWFPTDRPDLRAAAIRWAVAAPRVLVAHLRDDTTLVGEVRNILTPEELDWLLGWSNPPLGAGTALGQLVAAAGLAPQLQAELQRQVELYTNCAGGCERIFKTPIPPAYTRHTSRFVMLYVVTSPVLLWPATGWLTPLVAVTIAFLLLGTENIGVQIEEPFHVLPLFDICKALEANIRELERTMGGGTIGGATDPGSRSGGEVSPGEGAPQRPGVLEMAARAVARHPDRPGEPRWGCKEAGGGCTRLVSAPAAIPVATGGAAAAAPAAPVTAAAAAAGAVALVISGASGDGRVPAGAD